jgi:toxin FitB
VTHLLDTCVISELVKPVPDANLLRWFAEHDEDSLYLSVLSIGELERGIAKLPASRKKTRLGAWVREDMVQRFEGRLLAIDLAVVQRWGAMAGASERRGRPLPVVDSLIAATAVEHQLHVVSRNVDDFERCGVKCISPWVPPNNPDRRPR